MDIRHIPTDDPAFLAELLAKAHFVMAGLAQTLLIVSRTVTQDTIDGVELAREAAHGVAQMQRVRADTRRRAGDIIEAKVLDGARLQFEAVIRELLEPAPTRQ